MSPDLLRRCQLKIRGAWVATLAAFLAIACASAAVAGGRSSPPAVADLAVCDLDGTTLRLSWTCVAADGHPATAYDIRTAPTPILSEAEFGAASTLTGGPAPGPPGSIQTFDVTASGACAYFAMKVANAGAWSGLSNSAAGCAVNAVTDLSGTAGTHMVLVTWTAMGCTQTIGPPVAYDLRYSPSSINPANFSSAHQATAGSPHAPGAAECTQIFDLNANTTYYFALKVGDAQGNWSGLSNLASKKTRLTGDFVFDCSTGNVSVQNDPPSALRLSVRRAGPGSRELRFTIHCPAELVGQPASLRVLDVAGRSFGEWSSNGVVDVDDAVVPVRTGSLRAGIYFAHLTVGGHRVVSSVVVTP